MRSLVSFSESMAVGAVPGAGLAPCAVSICARMWLLDRDFCGVLRAVLTWALNMI